MSKYIPQINETNFVYPNFEISEYDVDIIHNINSNSVSGTVTNLVATLTTSTGLTFTHDYTWSKNGAEPYITPYNYLNLLSVHMLAAGQNYYKPWRCIDLVETATLTGSTYSGTNTIQTAGPITPSMMGLTTFISGTYYFEFRFIGLKAIYPVCQSLNITIT